MPMFRHSTYPLSIQSPNILTLIQVKKLTLAKIMNFEPPIVVRSQPVLYFFKTLATSAPFENRGTYLSPMLGATGTSQQREQLLQGRARTLPPSSRADRPRSVVVLFVIVVVAFFVVVVK